MFAKKYEYESKKREILSRQLNDLKSVKVSPNEKKLEQTNEKNVNNRTYYEYIDECARLSSKLLDESIQINLN